jgi:hypothetical protein
VRVIHQAHASNPAPIKPPAAVSAGKTVARERKLEQAQGARPARQRGELPPVIRHTEVVAFALVALLITL